MAGLRPTCFYIKGKGLNCEAAPMPLTILYPARSYGINFLG